MGGQKLTESDSCERKYKLSKEELSSEDNFQRKRNQLD